MRKFLESWALAPSLLSLCLLLSAPSAMAESQPTRQQCATHIVSELTELRETLQSEAPSTQRETPPISTFESNWQELRDSLQSCKLSVEESSRQRAGARAEIARLSLSLTDVSATLAEAERRRNEAFWSGVGIGAGALAALGLTAILILHFND